jgi:hypothetical protein
MTKKTYLLIGLVVVLGCLYIYFFTDWFAPKIIQIEHSVRPARDAWTGGGQRAASVGREANNVTFALNRQFKLTSIKVVPLAEYQTNQFAHPLWHLVSENGSDRTKALSYGFPVPKMTPSVAGAPPDPLVPGVGYRLIVEAGSWRGEHDFTIPLRAGARR